MNGKRSLKIWNLGSCRGPITEHACAARALWAGSGGFGGTGQGKRRVIGGVGSLRFRKGLRSTSPTLAAASLVVALQVLLSTCQFFLGKSALKTL